MYSVTFSYIPPLTLTYILKVTCNSEVEVTNYIYSDYCNQAVFLEHLKYNLNRYYFIYIILVIKQYFCVHICVLKGVKNLSLFSVYVCLV